MLLDQLLYMLWMLCEHLGIQFEMKTNAQNPHIEVIVYYFNLHCVSERSKLRRHAVFRLTLV